MKRLLLTLSALAASAGCNCGTSPGDLDGGNDGGFVIGGACTTAVSCYSGAAGTSGVGACKAGTAQCVDGALGACIGEVLPSAEACNGVDDDCNGTADDSAVLGNVSCGLGACKNTIPACSGGKPAACVPNAPVAEICGNGADDNCDGTIDEGCNCVYVAPAGMDTNPGTAALPLRSIQAGITVAQDAGIAQVCVAAGTLCPTTGAYAENVQMVNGISLVGAYQATIVPTDAGVQWPRLATCVVRINASDDKGVYFGPSITSPTGIDGFNIVASANASNAAVTVEGSTGAVVNNNAILGGGGQTSVGVNVLAGATPTISRNLVTGGGGAQLAIGVRSNAAKPTIVDNCGGFSAQGRCNQYCFNSVRSIRGRLAANVGAASYAVKLEDSPGATVERSALCSGAAVSDAAAVRITGDGRGIVVRASTSEARGGGANSVGIWADACNGAAPWLFDNHDIVGASPVMGSRADGVRAVGNCHVRVDSNQRIVGGEESSNNDAIGVFCARDSAASVSSRCTVQNNAQIIGSLAGVPPSSTGVRCDPGACALIENNRITGRGGVRTFGVVLDSTSTVLRKNDIEAGCGTNEAIGLLSVDSAARVENNTVRGAVCGAGAAVSPLSTAIKVLTAASPSELDLNGNTVPAFGSANGNCVSRGLVFDVADAGLAPPGRGVVRNNIVHGGLCNTATSVAELNASAEPRLFENNDLYLADGGTLYLDEGGTALPDVASVNGLGGAASNVSADPQFDGGVHLGSGSVCRNAGTASGAPTEDFEGDARPQESGVDIGADEFKP